MNILCPICSDLVNQADNIYVTVCGHVFHHHCLSQWIERSKTCPQCRNKVTPKCMFRLYPTISNENTGADDAVTLQSKLDNVSLQLRQQTAKVRETEEEVEKLKSDLSKTDDIIASYCKKLVSSDSTIEALEGKLQYLRAQNKEMNLLRAENEILKKNIQLLDGLQRVLNATSEEVSQMLQGYTDVKTVATFATALKRALCEAESKKNERRNQLHAVKAELSKLKNKHDELLGTIGTMQDNYTTLFRKYKALKTKNHSIEQEVKNMNDIMNTRDATSSVLVERNVNVEEDSALVTVNNNSIDLAVERIENSDSPYLNLRQSNLALATLQKTKKPFLCNIKPSERSMISKINRPTTSSTHTVASSSIFNKKEPMQIETAGSVSDLNTSYDGLGGHSKFDTFPVRKSTPIKSSIPKLTAKHKLKRPNPTGIQNIAEMLKKTKNT